MNKTIPTQEIHFSDERQALIVFPGNRADLPKAIKRLELAPCPVLVLIGGAGLVEARHRAIIEQSTRIVAKVAEQSQAIVVSGGTDVGVMAAIGQMRAAGEHSFPLIGVAPKSKVSWPGGPQDRRFLWWGNKRGPLEPHHTHFILVPGSQFGDESPWIVETATQLSATSPSVTMLVNGGKIARQDIALGLEVGRPVIVLAGTGRLADELAAKPPSSDLMTIIPVENETALFHTILTRLM